MANTAITDSSTPPLYIVYQPVVRLSYGQAIVHAYESLLRVGPNAHDHSTLTVIAAAELNGTMPRLDAVIARQVCHDAASFENMRLWMNLSQRTLSCPSISREIAAMIMHYGLADRITIEMTETANGDDQLIQESLSCFKQQQITVVIDDIDDGYAKSHLLASELIAGCKFSRRSTVRLMSEPGFADIAGKLIKWCKAHGKSVVMEGIENEVEYRMTNQLGADFCQGYYFWRPIPLCEVPAPGTEFQRQASQPARIGSNTHPTYLNTAAIPTLLAQ